MSKRLILGIDLQEGFLTDEARTNGFVERVTEFLAKQPKEQVILTKFINQPGSNFEKLINYTKLQADDPQSRLIGSLENQDYTVLEKGTYSAWQPELIKHIEQQGVREIVMFGLDSEACVLKTALDVFDAGLEPIVLEDLCFSSNGTQGHDAGINLLKVLIGLDQITTSALF